MTIAIPEYRATESNLVHLRDVLLDHRGSTDVRLALRGREKEQLVLLEAKLRVEPNPSLFGEIKTIFGPGCIRR